MNEMWSLRSTGPCSQSGVWLRWDNPQQNSAQQHTVFFNFHCIKNSKQIRAARSGKKDENILLSSVFPRPPWLFSVTVYPDEDDDRRGWAEKTAGPQQRRALGSIASLSCQHWPATIMHTQRLYPPGLFQHRNKTQSVYCSGRNIVFILSYCPH